jgi:hypothetical protein
MLPEEREELRLGLNELRLLERLLRLKPLLDRLRELRL